MPVILSQLNFARFLRRSPTFRVRSAALAFGTMLLAQVASAQTLEVKVVDPFSFAVTNATVAFGGQEVPTDVVSAPGFTTAIEAVAASEGAVTIELTLQLVSEVIDVQANVGT